MELSELKDDQIVRLVNGRWASSQEIWEVVDRVYKRNTIAYDMEFNDKDRIPDYIKRTPFKSPKVRDNRIFVNTEAVINSLIANPPKPNLLPGRNTPESIELASLQEQYFINKYDTLNMKEVVRKGLRNLYFGRLIVIKPYWNSKTNDFDAVALDPRKVRVAKYATSEEESEFVIEEVTDNLEAVMQKFPAKAEALLKKSGLSYDELPIINPQITYKEAWVKDRVFFTYDNLVLGNIRNPYWDWDGLLVTAQEDETLAALSQDQNEGALAKRKDMLETVRQSQEERLAMWQQQRQANTDNEGDAANPPGDFQTEPMDFKAYRFNHFNTPRKPYIFATVFNNENTPIGRTDMITEAIPLQEAIDRRKRQLDENAQMMNGWLKVDSEVMSKEDAQKLRYDTTGIVWGKGVASGVQRETGQPLPNFVFDDMVDSRQEIDNIMAASSSFRGEREGQETKAGRLALIEQSFLRLNEFVQVIDYVNQELFNWFYQLAKVRYTEAHYAKTMGDQNAVRIMELHQDDFEDGTEVRIISGKTLPEDKEFKFERAQADVEKGIIAPTDYFKEAGYSNPTQIAKNAELYKMNPPMAVGVSEEEMAQFARPPQSEPPKLSMGFDELPIDGQVQMAAKAGITLDPNLLLAKELKNDQKEQDDREAKKKQEKETKPPKKA